MRYYWERGSSVTGYDFEIYDRKGADTTKPIAIVSEAHYAEILVRAANQSYQAATLDNMNSNISQK